jgi:hypothetical protein
MAYIGREPQVGNFQVCDAISVVNGQAAYTMQVNQLMYHQKLLIT